MKKIIDVPESADFVNVNSEAVTSTGGLTRFNSARYTTSELEDAPVASENAPKKHVIELPADVIEGIYNAKTHYCGNVADFVLNAPSVVFPEIRKAIGEPHASYDKVADILGSWYFGNVDFVPKPEPKFYVRVYIDSNEKSVVNKKNSDGESRVFFDVFMCNEPTYNEEEADKLVAGLTALNARKVKVESTKVID